METITIEKQKAGKSGAGGGDQVVLAAGRPKAAVTLANTGDRQIEEIERTFSAEWEW